MSYGSRYVGLIASVMLAASAQAQDSGVTRPHLVLEQVVEAMPQDAKQSVSIMTATFKPGDRTVTHTHRFPVGVYVLDGVFTLELKGRAPLHIKAGEALVEPPNVEMTGYNRSSTELTKVVIFYVSTPGMPFLDMVH
jgi:quercetin dioxygenase-like cupin family protein